MVLQIDAKKMNEFEYKLNTIYFFFIIPYFYAKVYWQYFEFFLIYDFLSTIELLQSRIQSS